MDGIAVRITDLREVGPDAIALEIETPAEFDARPGQFIQLCATVEGQPVTRHYSISSPRITDTFEITVSIDPEGTLSPKLAEVTPGETVEIAGPYGRVYYEGESRVAILAAGPGIGAAVGIAERTLLEDGDAALVFKTSDLIYENRLARLASEGSRVYVVDDSDRFEIATETVLDERHIFVYGFETFVDAARAAIVRTGRDPKAAKIENFG